jgi:signal transduction histidine kinase
VNTTASPNSLTPADLADLLAAFNDATGKLSQTHEALRAEVARLTRDLSDANQQLERSRRLAALGEMAAGIAHEVRNPLGAIRLYARMLTDDLAAKPKQADLAAKIGRAATGLDRVVGDVLTFSREFKARREEITAGDLFDAVLEAVCHDGTPGWRSVRFVREGDATRLVGDPDLLRQALVNLVRNAVEAARDGGHQDPTVTLAAEALRARGKRPAAAVLRVLDNGPGIPGDVLARMFNPFFTTRAAGTGLGLAIVHRIVDAHAGRVAAASLDSARQQSGASFTIHLPLTDEAECSTRAAHAGGPTVMVPSVSPCMDAEVA